MINNNDKGMRTAAASLIALFAVMVSVATAAPVFSFQIGTGTAGNATGQFDLPNDVAVDSAGNIYVADSNNNRIQIFNSTGGFVRIFGTSGTATGQFNSSSGVAVDSTGNIYVADRNNNRIQIFNPAGGFIRTFGTFGNTTGQFDLPNDLAVDSAGRIYVADTGNDRIQVFNSTGGFILTFGTFGNARGQFESPNDVAVDGAGNIYVADAGNDRIQIFNSAGVFVRVFGTFGNAAGQFSFPGGIAIDGAGNIHVADSLNDRIQIFNSTGIFQQTFGTLGNAPGQFNLPRGIALDSLGKIYVADRNNDRIQVLAHTIVTGTVTNANTGAPVAGATVTAGGITATTDAAGSYSILDIASGVQTVTASAPGFVTVTASVNVISGQTVIQNFALQLAPTVVTGTVTNANTGAPIAGATLTAGGITATTDAAGSYSIINIAPGIQTVTASASGFVTSTASVNVNLGATVTQNFALQPVPAPSGGGGGGGGGGVGGGGGGGGGGASGENFSNIELKETYDEMIFKDIMTAYRFKHERNPIRFVNITGNINAGLITTTVEVLKGTSTLVKEKAPGTVFKNFNTWVGTSGFAVPKNIKEAKIVIRVEKSWLSANDLDDDDMMMLRWDGNAWIELETDERGEDAAFIFFEAETNTFSPFAFAGMKKPGGPAAGEPPVMAVPVPTQAPPTTPKGGLPGFELATAMAALSALYVFRRMRK